MPQVQDQLLPGAGGVGIPVHADPRGGRQFGADAVIGQVDGIVARGSDLILMGIPAPIPLFGCIGGARVQPDLPRKRHQQDVSEVRMPRPAEMPVAETDDGRIVMAVACAMVIDPGLVPAGHVMGNRVGVRAELDASEGNAGAGEGMPPAGGADKRINVTGRLAVECHGGGQDQNGEQESLHVPKYSKDSRKS